MQLSKAKIRYLPEVQDNKGNLKKTNRVSAFTEDFRGEYYNIALEKLLPFKSQARRHFDDDSIKALAQTVKEHGIRQPLTVIPSIVAEGCYEIVSGERRFRAAKLLGFPTVPCIIIFDHKKAEEIAIIENLQRKNLHPIELKNAFLNLLEKGICESTSKIAEKVGVKKSLVVETLALKTLPEDIQETLLQKKLTSRKLLRALCKADSSDYNKLIDSYIADKSIEFVSKEKGKTTAGLKTKATILTLLLEAGELKVSKNKLSKLSPSQKEQILSIISELFKAA